MSEKKIVVELTRKERNALIRAMRNFSDYGEEEMLGLFHTKAGVKAAYSALKKLEDA